MKRSPVAASIPEASEGALLPGEELELQNWVIAPAAALAAIACLLRLGDSGNLVQGPSLGLKRYALGGALIALGIAAALRRRAVWTLPDESSHLPAQIAALDDATAPLVIFDVHCHYLDFHQHTQGVPAMLDALHRNNVLRAALTGCGLKKRWSDSTKKVKGIQTKVWKQCRKHAR